MHRLSGKPSSRCCRWLAVAAFVAVWQTGCEAPEETSKSVSTQGPVDASTSWPFWPTQMRITPLTRLTIDGPTGLPVIEARVEFLDSQGVTSRAVGSIRFELLDTSLPNEQTPVQKKEQQLRTVEENQRFFDVVTRTYLFRLEIVPERWPTEPLLKAVFTSADGQVLEATRRLRSDAASQ